MGLSDKKYINLAKKVSLRSVCIRRRVGAVIEKDGQILSSGHNGPSAKLASCKKTGCAREEFDIGSGEELEICRGICAEQAALISCLQEGKKTKGATIYVTHQPCPICTRLLIASEISRIVYIEAYSSDFSKLLLEEAGVILEKWQNRQL